MEDTALPLLDQNDISNLMSHQAICFQIYSDTILKEYWEFMIYIRAKLAGFNLSELFMNI